MVASTCTFRCVSKVGKLFPFKRPPDRMDRIVQEAREEGLLHGPLKRTIMSAYQGHQNVKWMQRAGTAMIVGVLVGLAATWFGWPVPVVVALFGICALVSAICIVIGLFHLFRYFGILARPPERDEANENTQSGGNGGENDGAPPDTAVI